MYKRKNNYLELLKSVLGNNININDYIEKQNKSLKLDKDYNNLEKKYFLIC